MQKIAILFNPSSRRGRSGKSKDRIERTLNAYNIKYDLFMSKSESHLKQLALDTAKKYPTIVGVGGDTTLNIMVRQLLRFGSRFPAMGMIGTGSANDIVRSLGIFNIEDACAAIKKGITSNIDVGCIKINNKSKPYFFLGSLSTGLGTTVNRYVDQFQQKHRLISKIQPFYQFFPGICGVYNSFSKKKLPLQIKIQYPNGNNGDSIMKSIEFSLLVFLNTSYYASGLKLGKDNGPFDGILDCCMIDTKNFWETFFMAIRIQRGTHTRCHNVRMVHSPTFKIHSPEPIDILADGEIIESVTEFEVSVIKNKIRFLCV